MENSVPHVATTMPSATVADLLRVFRTRGYGVRTRAMEGVGVCGAVVTLFNGWQLSIQCGPFSQSTNFDYPHPIRVKHSSHWFKATTMEVAVLKPNGGLLDASHTYEFATVQEVIDIADKLHRTIPPDRNLGAALRAVRQALFG